MRSIQVKILDPRLGAEFPLPNYATGGSAGMDLRAMVTQPMVLEPGTAELIPTGVAIHIQDPGLAGMIGFCHPKSNHGVLVEFATPIEGEHH